MTVKRTLLISIPLLLIFFYPLFLVADELTEITKKARIAGRPVILYFYTKHCPYCEKMDRETLTRKEISQRLAKEVFFLRIDGDEHSDIPRQYRIRAFPTIGLLDAKGDHLVNVVGYMDKKDFTRILDYLKGGHYRSMKVEDYFRRQKQ